MKTFPKTSIQELAARYEKDPAAAADVVRGAFRAAESGPPEVWIHRVPEAQALAELEAARERRARGESLPLYGIPYAVKDSLDVAGMPTTVACPAFSYVPQETAPVLERLRAAGAILVGKTNLDQFATGLVGVRSPYGVCKNPFDPRYLAGGSSSGSAIAVSTGQVPFSIGTDTAGSGRVPAAFQDIVGFKPTRGMLSARGLVPACKTIDCVSIFATSSTDARTVFDACAAFDPEDPYSRDPARAPAPRFDRPLRVGVPRESQWEFFGDDEMARLYREGIARFSRIGAKIVEVDLAPFRAAAELLYSGPWVVERLQAAGELLARSPESLHPAVRSILEGASRHTALAVYQGQYALAAARRGADLEWAKMDVLFVPTAPRTYTIEEVMADPIVLNSRLGHYTQFGNLLDLVAVAVPAGFRRDGLPLGVSLIAEAFSDRELLAIAARFEAARDGAPAELETADVPHEADLLVAVAGAHLTGQPLNHQLTSRRARLVRACRTSRHYRLFALANTVPPKPGLVFDVTFDGPGMEIEVWALSAAAFGSFVDEVQSPLAIGNVVLEDGTTVNGFVAESHALQGATEITQFGGWRRFREHRTA